MMKGLVSLFGVLQERLAIKRRQDGQDVQELQNWCGKYLAPGLNQDCFKRKKLVEAF